MLKPLLSAALAMHAAVAGWIPDAHAATWPEKPIRLVIGFPAGVVDDFIARTVGPKLSERLGQNFVVDNRPGAVGNLAADMVAHAPADGYTLLMVGSISLASSRSLYAKLGYDLFKDFAYIGTVATSANLLIAHPSFPAKSVSELVALAKAKPKSIRYGSAGIASTGHLAMGLLENRAGIEVVHVPYKGAVAAVVGLAGGEVQVAIVSTAAAAPLIANKKVNVIAATSPKRLAALPDVQTIADDYKGFNVISTFGFLAPIATPPAVIERLSRELSAVAQLPEVKAKFAEQGIEAVSSTSREFKSLMEFEVEQWGRVIRDSHITVN